MPREDAVAKSWSKTFDLRLDARQHVEGGAIGNMAIRPGYVLAFGSAARIEQGRLGEQHKRLLGVKAMSHGIFRGGNLRHGSAQVHGCGARTIGGPPWDRLRECVIHLEDSRRLAVTLELSAVRRGKTLAGYLHQVARSDITEGGVELTKRSQAVHSA